MPRFERAELWKKFRAMVERGEPIVGGGAGTGLSAKCEEAGGIDLIVIYNSDRYAAFILKHTRKCHGFYGASSIERLPVERALTEQVRKFKAIGRN
jgi:predicted TIM-barrel enzyme